MAQKVNKSEKIRALLKRGLSVAAVAKKAGVSPAYVYTVRWHADKKAAKKKVVKAAKPKAKPVAKKARKAKAVAKRKPSLKKADMEIIALLLMQINDTLRGVLAALSPQVEVVPVHAPVVEAQDSPAQDSPAQDSPAQGDLFDDPDFDISHEDRDAA